MSPDCTPRFPPVKLPAEYKVPVVPLFVLLVVKKHPAMVALALTVNDVDVDAFDPADAEFHPTDGRVELEYATLSLHPAWDDMVSPAA